MSHQHFCAVCGFVRDGCYCDAPIPSTRGVCADRVPGERNLACPTALAMGRASITQLMLAEHQASREAASQRDKEILLRAIREIGVDHSDEVTSYA